MGAVATSITVPTAPSDSQPNCLMFSTSIGENHYLNVVVTKDEDSNKDIAKLIEAGWKPNLVKYFWLVKYEVKGDVLSVWDHGSWTLHENS